MIDPMHSRTRSLLLPVLFSLGLISCAQTQKHTGNTAPGPLFNFWQQTKPLLASSQRATVSEPLNSVEAVKMATSAKQRKAYSTSSDFFTGLSPAEIEVVRMEAWKAYRPHWRTIAKRSRYVGQPLLDTLVKMGAPEELQMIPIVESSYDPYAQSEVGATGLWQLMPSTATDLRIKSDRFIDGRRDIRASTRGAAKFLLKQYKRFGNWPLAFAAYHLGARGVQKRINRRPWQPEDGLRKIPLPPITKTYVRNILGLISLYQVREFVFPKPFPTETVHVQTPINLDTLHKKAELPKYQLFRFNPELNLKHYYDENASAISLRVTRWRVPAVKKHILTNPAEYLTISIREGERLKDIVKRYNTSVSELHQSNSGNLTLLAKAGKLRIPLSVLKRVQAGKNPLVKPPIRMLADNSSLSL